MLGENSRLDRDTPSKSCRKHDDGIGPTAGKHLFINFMPNLDATSCREFYMTAMSTSVRTSERYAIDATKVIDSMVDNADFDK